MALNSKTMVEDPMIDKWEKTDVLIDLSIEVIGLGIIPVCISYWSIIWSTTLFILYKDQ